MPEQTVTPAASLLRQGYDGWRFSAHALERMDQMHLNWRLVLSTVRHPASDYPSDPRFHPGCRVATSAKLAVVYDVQDQTIITVLWNGRSKR